MFLSIIIPVWNGERFVGNLLSQLAAQNLEDVEVIVVNDGSTDNTENVVLEYANKDTHIKLISLKENAGVSVARNTGIENAIGKYIWFLDSDDAIPDNAINILYNVINDKTANVFIFGFKHKRGTNYIDRINHNLDNRVMNAGQLLKKRISRRGGIYICMCNIIFAREVLIKENLYFVKNRQWGEDVEFYMKVFASSNRIYYSSCVIFIHIYRDDSATQGGKIYVGDRVESDILMLLEMSKCILEKQPSLKKYMNYYVARIYAGYIKRYIQHKQKDEKTNDILIKHRYILAKPLAFYFPETILFWGMRFIPMKILFRILGKGERYL
jgi:glycosyltransferase involved in cell wall biosynthesis